MLKGFVVGDIDFIGEVAASTVSGAQLVDYMGASRLHLWKSVTNHLAPATSAAGPRGHLLRHILSTVPNILASLRSINCLVFVLPHTLQHHLLQ